MPTINELMDLRPAIEEDIRSYLTSQNISAFTRQNAPENFQLVLPRVEIKAQIGGVEGHRFLCPDGQLRYDVWYFNLALMCCTEPENIEADNLLQNQFVALVRGFASTMAQNAYGDLVNFPNHVIAEPLKDSGTDENLKSDDNFEYSVLTFDGKIAIRQEVWPN